MTASDPLTTWVPPVDPERRSIEAPVTTVTLLEDRAQIIRRGRVSLAAGQNRLVLLGVAPVLRDVSLRAEASEGAAVLDARVQRALRVRLADKPEAARVLEAEIREHARSVVQLEDEQHRATERLLLVWQMLERGAEELPQDVAWGLHNAAQWSETFSALFERARALRHQALERRFEAEDVERDLERLITRRQHLDRPDCRLAARIELDVRCEAAGEVELCIHYVVPNAIWRPIHSAQLREGALTFTSSAAVWQNTGEDWDEVNLIFSTARSSLGTEPPLLTDDRLEVQRRSDQVVLQARQVAVQRAGVAKGDAAGAARAIEAAEVALPGVDDGGEIRNLHAQGPTTVPSDGRPAFIPVFDFTAPVEPRWVLMAEVEPKVFLKAVGHNGAPQPILAGPVELVRESGVVGWSQILFVAPGERFELGFGPADDLRISREVQQASRVDPIDGWRHTETLVSIYLSNLGTEPRQIELTERVPVSEVEEVKIALIDHAPLIEDPDTQPLPFPRGSFEVDADGMCVAKCPLDPRGHRRVQLSWRVSIAPGVQGI